MPTLQFAGGVTFPSAAERSDHLGRLVQEQRLQNFPCIAVLSADSYQLNQADLAELPEEERRDAARWQIRERIDYSAEEAVIDLFEIAPIGGEKKPLTYIVSAQKKLLKVKISLMLNLQLPGLMHWRHL